MAEAGSALKPEAFAAAAGVSRETFERLSAYIDLLRRWNERIDLVAPSTMADPWRRHMLDSAQIAPLLPPCAGRRLVDLGSGAGFPGLVLAILGVGEVHLVESDHRKAAFLREAARVTATPVTVHAVRAEGRPVTEADVVTARALAPLARLLPLAAPLLKTGGVAVFPKGRQVDNELTEAARHWKMVVERFPSRSDPGGTVLRLEGIDRV